MTRYAPLWQQGGSYAASVDRGLLSTLWPSGGVTGGAVTAVANTMTVSVAPGTVAVPLQAGQGVALCRWDAAEVVTVATAPTTAGQSRIDVIVAQVRDNALDAGANNDFVFAAVTGTAATTPTVPATPANAYAMAQVTVAANVANLNGATLKTTRGPLRVGTSSLAWRNAAYTFPTGGYNWVSPDTVAFDDTGGFAAGPASFIAPVTALWRIEAQAVAQFSGSTFAWAAIEIVDVSNNVLAWNGIGGGFSWTAPRAVYLGRITQGVGVSPELQASPSATAGAAGAPQYFYMSATYLGP
jgi:hypothetical protein